MVAECVRRMKSCVRRMQSRSPYQGAHSPHEVAYSPHVRRRADSACTAPGMTTMPRQVGRGCIRMSAP